MNLITEDQSLTLRHWAFAIKRRPGNSAKLSLKLEKGLTEEQIDKWWDDAMLQISQGPSRKRNHISIASLTNPNSYLQS
jgi:hypothetical protein